MTEPRRVLIASEYEANGIELVPTREEYETPLSQRRSLTAAQRPGGPYVFRPWGERLSEQLLSDLKAWNDSWDTEGFQGDEEISVRALQERGKELAIRVQNELGTDDWEVLYKLGGRVHRVHPPGSWPVETWMRDLLGYTHLDPRVLVEAEARARQWLRDTRPQSGTDDSRSG